jgi:hypothetical protein
MDTVYIVCDGDNGYYANQHRIIAVFADKWQATKAVELLNVRYDYTDHGIEEWDVSMSLSELELD